MKVRTGTWWRRPAARPPGANQVDPGPVPRRKPARGTNRHRRSAPRRSYRSGRDLVNSSPGKIHVGLLGSWRPGSPVHRDLHITPLEGWRQRIAGRVPDSREPALLGSGGRDGHSRPPRGVASYRCWRLGGSGRPPSSARETTTRAGPPTVLSIPRCGQDPPWPRDHRTGVRVQPHVSFSVRPDV